VLLAMPFGIFGALLAVVKLPLFKRLSIA